jgi:hypothetical protein
MPESRTILHPVSPEMLNAGLPEASIICLDASALLWILVMMFS